MSLFKRNTQTSPTEIISPVEEYVPDPSPWDYPDGICVKTEKTHYYIKGKKRFKIRSQEILDSWSFAFIVDATESSLVKYPIIGSLGFRDGSLISNVFDGKLYLVSGNKRRPIKTTQALQRLGIYKDDFLLVSDEDLNLQDEGEII